MAQTRWHNTPRTGDNLRAKQCFLELSKRSPKYQQIVKTSDIEKIWRSYSERAKIATIATLIHDVKQHKAKTQGIKEEKEEKEKYGPKELPQRDELDNDEENDEEESKPNDKPDEALLMTQNDFHQHVLSNQQAI
jgi:hypothetical protein